MSIVNFPYFPIPPPPAHVVPPPPHHPIGPSPPIHPPPLPPHVVPPPPPPPQSPDNGPTIIIVVYVSFGCILFLAFCLVALWCFMKKRKNKTIQETDIIRTEEHLKIKEAIIEGPHRQQSIVLSIEDDKHVEEDILKTGKFQGKRMASKSRELADDIEGGESSSRASVLHDHHNPEQRH